MHGCLQEKSIELYVSGIDAVLGSKLKLAMY